MVRHVEVMLIGDHPHAGTRGRIPIDAQGRVTVSTLFGARMVLVYLIDSPLLTQSAYAEGRHLGKACPLDEEPRRKKGRQ